MPSYQSIDEELKRHRTPANTPDWDALRRKKLKQMEEHTNRPVLVYAVDFLNDKVKQVGAAGVQIDFFDKHGFFEITDQISDPAVDIIIHSPGGLPDAAESIVAMLRSQFQHIRFIIPNIAKSAATLMAMAGDEILMDRNAELGPVDPQLVFGKGDGSAVQAPAQAIVDQFEEAQALIGREPKRLPAWLPILQQYGPSLYKQAQNAIGLSTQLVEEWLTNYMLKDDPERATKAQAIAAYLGDHNKFKSHGRRIGREALQNLGAKITNLEHDKPLLHHVQGVYYSVVHTFNGPCFKLFENSRGQGLFRLIKQSVELKLPPGIPLPGLPIGQPPGKKP